MQLTLSECVLCQNKIMKKEPVARSHRRLIGLPQLTLCRLLLLAVAFFPLAKTFGAEESPLKWVIKTKKLHREGIELRLILARATFSASPIAGAPADPIGDIEMEVREVNGTFSYAPPRSFESYAVTISTNENAEIAALIRLTEAFARAKSSGEFRASAEARAYSGKLGPVWDAEKIGNDFKEIRFEKKARFRNNITIIQPEGLLWLLKNLSVFAESRAAIGQSVIADQESQARARETRIVTAKQESEARLKNLEEQKRKAVLIESEKQTLADIAHLEETQRIEIDKRIEKEVQDRLTTFLSTKSGKALLKQIREVESAAFQEQAAKRAALNSKLKPLQVEYERLLEGFTATQKPQRGHIG